MFMESAQTWGSRARGHSLGQGPTKRVPPLLVARVTRPERALSQGAAEQGEHRADYRRFCRGGGGASVYCEIQEEERGSLKTRND